MNSRIAFLTTIFPMESEYISDFFSSLEEQTYTEFDVVVVNDGYLEFERISERYRGLNIIELKYSDTPAKNREYGINYVKNNKYEILIFGDSDDYFSSNRVQVTINKLASCDILVNDFTLFNKAGMLNSFYISKRIENNNEIDLEYVKDKNIFGMTNTAVNVNVLRNVDFDGDLVAVDWYFFSILLSHGKKAIFTNEAVTYYRQYSGNTVGIGIVSNKSIANEIEVKLKHYQLMRKENCYFENLYKDIIAMRNSPDLRRLTDQNRQNLFWWEGIRSSE